MKVSIHLILVILAFLLFGIAAVAPPEPWPWRLKFIAAGLSLWALSTIVTI